jgi:hypothetical protein
MIKHPVPERLRVDAHVACASLFFAEIMSKKQQELLKRDVTITDKSGAAVKLTIWGDNFNLDEHQLQPPSFDKRQPRCNILAVSGARISDFSGCSLVRNNNTE